MSRESGEFACAGFILQSSAHDLSVRLSGEGMSDTSSPYPMFSTYREMGTANDASPDDLCLALCRDDGQ